MNFKYPLQKGGECVANAYWVAMSVALEQADPYRKLSFTPKKVEAVTGSPCSVHAETVVKLRAAFGDHFTFNTIPMGEDGMPTKHLTLESPTVVSNWQYTYGHAFCLLPTAPDYQVEGSTLAYDPGLANVVVAQLDKCAGHTKVSCLNPEPYPYARWYWRFGILRSLLKPS